MNSTQLKNELDKTKGKGASPPAGSSATKKGAPSIAESEVKKEPVLDPHHLELV